MFSDDVSGFVVGFVVVFGAAPAVDADAATATITVITQPTRPTRLRFQPCRISLAALPTRVLSTAPS